MVERTIQGALKATNQVTMQIMMHCGTIIAKINWYLSEIKRDILQAPNAIPLMVAYVMKQAQIKTATNILKTTIKMVTYLAKHFTMQMDHLQDGRNRQIEKFVGQMMEKVTQIPSNMLIIKPLNIMVRYSVTSTNPQQIRNKK